MKMLEIGGRYGSCYLFPKGIDSMEAFITFLNEHYHSFIPMMQLLDDKCVKPFFIQEDIQQVYVNVQTMNRICEFDGEILPRSEYEKRLKEIVNSYCVNCVYYEEDSKGDNLTGHREQVCLNGTCRNFEQKK